MSRDYEPIIKHNDEQSDWKGEERRRKVRRQGEDRREMIRFELDKDDRRSGEERRKDIKSAWDSGTTI